MNAGNCGGLEALAERYTEISGFGRFERPKKRAQEGPLVATLARNGTKRGEIERNNRRDPSQPYRAVGCRPAVPRKGKMAGNVECILRCVAALSLLGEADVTSDFGEERRCKKLDFYFLPN